MDGKRQKIGKALTRQTMDRSEAPDAGLAGVEPCMAVTEPESPASTGQLMEEVCKRENLQRAWQRVRRNVNAGLKVTRVWAMWRFETDPPWFAV